MTSSVYLTSVRADSVRSIVALGLMEALKGRHARVGLFRPLVDTLAQPDTLVELLRTRCGTDQSWSDPLGVSFEQYHQAPDQARTQILQRYRAIARQCDTVIVLGSDYRGQGGGEELGINAQVAADLGLPVLLVVGADGWNTGEVLPRTKVAIGTMTAHHASVVAVVANRCVPEDLGAIRDELTHLDVPAYAIPESHYVTAPSLREAMAAIGGKLLAGDETGLDTEALTVQVAAMNADALLARLAPGGVVVMSGGRAGALSAVLAAAGHEGFATPAGIVLTDGLMPSDSVARLVATSPLPVIATELTADAVLVRLRAMRPQVLAGATRKIEAALALFTENTDSAKLLDAIDRFTPGVITPLAFQANLVERAQADKKRIVLPESEDARVLEAAARVLALGAADITLLGIPEVVQARAKTLGLDLAAARIQDPAATDLVEPFAEKFAELRKKKGVTIDQARETMKSGTYIGTMMIYTGQADGMVSGACHTTADTIRPSFQIIKTKPGSKIVSSVFLMAMADRVLAFGDCAVNPNPTAEELADIAVTSAATAQAFGIDPRVAMLSYSTGTSGKGPDVDLVTEATALAKAAAPDLAIDGPIQFDAAVVPSVAATKMPDSPVAGRATVFVFPSLEAGNICYKAVQRSSGALAIGPVLQGLNKPVNDLSRGATPDDIVNTIIITAIQAAA
ncbi:MAG: phosphate acetyltransferase [Bifidobacteriaceae bacterium]|jgi:phosphate acetyltransferase|nr:phosphate acetyltransferase [Bifidobacteriaceae bacterium]